MQLSFLEDRVRQMFDAVGYIKTSGRDFFERLDESFYGVVDKDLRAFSQRNPAAARPEVLASTSIGFDAVLSHRISHSILCTMTDLRDHELWAFGIYESSFARSGIDIHPRATIGEGLVVDHGWGLVVGETCEIGTDCYLLGGVILGALGISENPRGKRHPTLGDRVEVGQHTRILGAINIGSDVLVSPNCVICTDVPANSHVRIINQLQFTRPSADGIKVYGVVPHENGFEILGDGLQAIDDIKLEVGGATAQSEMRIVGRSRQRIQVDVTNVAESDLRKRDRSRLIAIVGNAEKLVITSSVCLDKCSVRGKDSAAQQIS